MNKTLRISFSLKNTYRVNSILYAIKQIPLIKKLFPDTIYQIWGLKIFANVLSGLWEIAGTFLGKLLYILLMIVVVVEFPYQSLESESLFLHILLPLSVIGAFMNTYMFNPTKDKYYAMILMRMNARAYTLVNYTYAMLKFVIGLLPFVLLFGREAGVSLWICLLIPVSIAGMKLTVAAYALNRYEKKGKAKNENMPGMYGWLGTLTLLAAAYGLPALKIVLPVYVSLGIMAVAIVCGAFSVRKILAFGSYREMYQEILIQNMNQMDEIKTMTTEASRKSISADTAISSNRKGFEYLNEIFVKRHQKILWKSSKKIAFVCFCLIVAFLLVFYLMPQSRETVNGWMMTFFPNFVFIMYAINRGTGFTNALFMNCDHSLLTYSFYKQPKFILKLFQIRLREIVKVNLLPALVIGVGLAVLLYASGGTDNPLDYVVLFISTICMSIFFSVHYLTVYYLLQPYNAGTEIKSGTYQIVLTVTYIVCFGVSEIELPTFVFGLSCIVFCVLYCILACVLAYWFAPKTFKLRI